jgi:hypothetical protein
MEGAYIQMSGTQQLDLWCQRAALPTTRGRELPQAATSVDPMSVSAQSRRFGDWLTTSGLPPSNEHHKPALVGPAWANFRSQSAMF